MSVFKYFPSLINKPQFIFLALSIAYLTCLILSFGFQETEIIEGRDIYEDYGEINSNPNDEVELIGMNKY